MVGSDGKIAMDITVELLTKHSVSGDKIEQFSKQYPSGITHSVTISTDTREAFNWDWASENLLSTDYARAYESDIIPFVAKYEAGVSVLCSDYDDMMKIDKDAALHQFNASVDVIRIPYLEAKAEYFEKHYQDNYDR